MKEAAETRDKMIEEARVKAREEANRMLMEAKMQIEAEKQNALSDVKSSVATISVQVAEKILHQKLSTADVQMDLIDSVLSKVSVQDK